MSHSLSTAAPEHTTPSPAPAGAAPDPILLELVDPNGATTGVAEKLSAHRSPGILHRAFSVFLVDGDGRLLLQRRALGKYHSPGVWSNTCCGHPYPQERPLIAALRRVGEELGAAPALLREAGTVTYRHPDPASGLVEHEFNHLFVGRLDVPSDPDPDEVAQVRAVGPGELEELRAAEPFSVWFTTVWDAARPQVRDLVPGAGW
ncbi:isopentenyl-diphosphate Delta-isomerase [Nocardiopsis flavescens]|uniref:Isopentenyl-diphosphate Delta-isomerase n=1 Tax=Nocardiopsis flavescens TaxID=758803 RepID=A0A1M6H3G1_9ACTN|nr:isopentenyl-diphosphate Delta-isomerase [Nocardiopsis flavescens]SHJ16767.1 isopentenyl-diphosphate delta-isomerase [Nocardiopsis flavescens]